MNEHPECSICWEDCMPTGQPLVKCGTCQKTLHVSCAMNLKDTRCPSCRSTIFPEIPCDDARLEVRLEHAFDTLEEAEDRMEEARALMEEAERRIRDAQQREARMTKVRAENIQFFEEDKRLRAQHCMKKEEEHKRYKDCMKKEEELNVIEHGLGCCFIVLLLLIPFFCIGIADVVAYIRAEAPYGWAFILCQLPVLAIALWLIVMTCSCCYPSWERMVPRIPDKVRPFQDGTLSVIMTSQQTSDIEEGNNLLPQSENTAAQQQEDVDCRFHHLILCVCILGAVVISTIIYTKGIPF